MTEGVFPKSDGDVLYASEANNKVGNFREVEAGETVTAGDLVYIHLTNGEAYVSGTDTADVRANGIAVTGGADGESITIQTGGIYITTGLTAKQDYYLAASGALSTTLSGVRVGTALSTTELWVDIIQDDRDAIGTVKAYLKSFTAIPSNNLTSFWVECNGGALSDAESILNGQTLPDLNGSSGTECFLRGQTTSGGTGGSETHTHSIATSGAGAVGGETRVVTNVTGSTSTLPTYYEVVWIMKIK